MVTVVVTGHSSRRSTPPRWTPTGNGLQRGQFCWPPLGRTVGRQRAATWPPLGRISWQPTLVERLGSGGLELHPDKTKIVYCKDTKRRDEAEHTSFDFLGYTFRGRLARGRRGFFVSFSPAMSPKAKKAIGEQIRDWHLNRRSATDLAGLAGAVNARIRGWFNYYGAFYRCELYAIATRIDEHLVRWAMQKFKRLRGQPTKAWRWLDAARQREPQLFAHWHLVASTPRRTVGAV